MFKKKIVVLSLVVILLITGVITFSYAFWGMTNEQKTMNKLTSGCLSIELVGEDAISLNNSFPITDEEGMVLKPYSFTITNTCDLFVSYNVSLEILNGSTLPIKYVRSMINKEAVVNLNSLESTTTSISGSIDSKILTTGSLGSGDSADYTLRIWMDENVTIENTDAINKSLQSKVVVTAVPSSYSPVANGFTNLADALLVNEYQTTNVDVAKNKIASKQEVDTTKTAPVIVWKETMDNNVTQINASKPDSSLIGKYGVNENSTKLILGKSYSFNPDTGYYTLTDYEHYDPLTVDFESSDYYFASGGINLGNDNVNSPNQINGNVIYKIKNLLFLSPGSLTMSSGVSIPVNTYRFNAYMMSEIEVESDKSDKGLYEAKDDFGTTYYYRGNVTNNYVRFAGFDWRVVRINGDGSVRLIYSHVTTSATGTGLFIGSSAFNDVRNNPTYVGYMYSNTLNTSYEDTISNDNDSAIKIKLDNWYKSSILDKNFSSYVADSGFCNDRSIARDSSGTGTSDSENTYYTPRYRYRNKVPTFICPNAKNDLFTLSGNTNGNEALTYPIGLITVDEVMYSGYVYGVLNKMAYTYSDYAYWTMSPVNYRVSDVAAIGWAVGKTGQISDNYMNGGSTVRPVINLKSTTEISGGIGTKNDPFIIK